MSALTRAGVAITVITTTGATIVHTTIIVTTITETIVMTTEMVVRPKTIIIATTAATTIPLGQTIVTMAILTATAIVVVATTQVATDPRMRALFPTALRNPRIQLPHAVIIQTIVMTNLHQGVNLDGDFIQY